MSISVVVPLPPYGLSLNSRLHWAKRVKLRQEYRDMITPIVNVAVNGHQPYERAHVAYYWHSTHQVDADNAISRLKPLLDVLEGRAIVNDRDVTLSFTWLKVRRKSDEEVVVFVREGE